MSNDTSSFIHQFKTTIMARLKGNIPFTGSLGNLSAYTRKGSNAIILRTKGGASKEKIKKAPEFANTRKVNTEFGGASAAARHIKLAMTGLTHLDHTLFQSRLTSICSAILKMDTENANGQRLVLISRYGRLLEGFNLEMGTIFDSIVKHPLLSSITRETLSASIDVPALFPGISLYLPGKFSLFRLIAVLGIVPDLTYHQTFGRYQPINPSVQLKRAVHISQWFNVSEICVEQNIKIKIEGDTGISATDSLLLSVGIEFGIPVTTDFVQPVNYAGAAKILVLS